MAEQLPKVEITQQAPKPANPLAGYFRQPKIYIKLPSGGQFYPEGALDVSENGDYPVYSMTAKDELMMKTPDALLSGETTVEVIKSCVPAIRNPWQMPTLDIDAVLMAIRIATYGDTMDIMVDCPKCNEDNKYGVQLTQYLNQAQAFKYQDTLQVGPLTITLKPYSYKMLTNINIKALEQQRIFSVVNDDKMSDEEKLEKFNKSFVKLSELTIDVIAQCIVQISSPEGTTNDFSQVKEFLDNSPKDVFTSVSQHIGELKEKINIPDQNVKCEKCEHEFSVPVTLDASNFFADRS